jgi:TolA-binding protein
MDCGALSFTVSKERRPVKMKRPPLGDRHGDGKATPTATVAWAIAFAALAALLCVTPLFDVLGYELGLALALPASLLGAQLGVMHVRRLRSRRPPSLATFADAHPLATVMRLFARALVHAWLILLLPLLILLGNAARVRNCDVGGGLAWFAMLPVASAAMGAALGVAVGVARAWRSRVIPIVVAVAVILASLAYGVYRFYAAPPIFGFDPFLGYFAGTLYDEDIGIGRAFFHARLYHACLAMLLLAACAWMLDGATLTLRASAVRGRHALLMSTAALIFACGLLHHNRAHLGFDLDARSIARLLGGEQRSEHFVFRFSHTGPYAKELDRYAADAEFRWHELEKFFGHAPPAPITVFLFDDADQKRRLMGAAQTFIAKPWRREIYLQFEPWPQQVEWHELAHVFAGQYGDGLFGIARKGLHFNVGLIEGVAVAASWAGNPLTPHQQVKVLRDQKIVGREALAQVMSPRFFGLNAGQAYALAGSFVRFLVDEYGADKLEQLFHEAGAGDSWRRIYGADFATLADRWLAFVDAVPVPADEARLALARLSRPSVFHKACAHALAARRRRAHDAANAGDKERALAEWSALCRDEPDDPAVIADALDAALAAEAKTDAQLLADRLLERHDPIFDGRAHMTLGDLALAAGDAQKAAAAYARALAAPLDESIARLATVKLLVARMPPGPERDPLAAFLTTPPPLHDAAVDLMSLRALVDAHPDRALYHYLLARQLLNKGRWGDAVVELQHPVTDKLPDERFDREARRWLGQAQLRLGDLPAARASFDALASSYAGSPVDIGPRLDAEDWRARVDFFRAHPQAGAELHSAARAK